MLFRSDNLGEMNTAVIDISKLHIGIVDNVDLFVGRCTWQTFISAYSDSP